MCQRFAPSPRSCVSFSSLSPNPRILQETMRKTDIIASAAIASNDDEATVSGMGAAVTCVGSNKSHSAVSHKRDGDERRSSRRVRAVAGTRQRDSSGTVKNVNAPARQCGSVANGGCWDECNAHTRRGQTGRGCVRATQIMLNMQYGIVQCTVSRLWYMAGEACAENAAGKKRAQPEIACQHGNAGLHKE